MRFMMMTSGGEANQEPPSAEIQAQMGAFIEEMSKAGYLVATGGLDPRGKHIRSQGGKVTVTDGPFSEAKEVVVGFALIEVDSEEKALELSRRFWEIVGDGEGTVQRVFGPEDAPEF